MVTAGQVRVLQGYSHLSNRVLWPDYDTENGWSQGNGRIITPPSSSCLKRRIFYIFFFQFFGSKIKEDPPLWIKRGLGEFEMRFVRFSPPVNRPLDKIVVLCYINSF